MENTGRRKNGRLHKLITAVLASVFVASLVSTISTIAAANLFKIQSAELTELSATAEGTILSYDDLNVNSNVTFHKLNDYAKYTITLKNNDSVEHVIESITDDNANPYITYDYDQHANEQINAGENLVFVVTAKYTTAVADMNQRAQANNVKFFIHFTDIDEEVILVPNTGVSSNVGNTIRVSVITLIISAVGLTIFGVIVLKKNKKASKYIFAGIIAVLAIVATATARAATVEINSFTFVNNFALKDRLVVNWTDVNGDENEMIVSYNEPANIPDQSKNGHTFTGWADENGNSVDLTQPITDDIKVYPTFRIHRYTVRFAPNIPVDGTLDPVITMDDMSLAYDEEKNLTANQYNVTGYLFDSWNTASDGSGTKYEDMESIKNLSTVDGDVVTLYARWGATPYTVIFDKNHNDATGAMESISKAYNETFNLPANTYTRTGYNFTGWNTSPVGDGTHYDDEQSVKNLDINGRITLYAEWAPIVAVITFDKNSDEATGSMANQTVVYDVQNRLDDNGFIRENYNFMGWNTQADGQGTHYDNKADVTNTFFTNVTLYAQWSAKKYTVKFDKNTTDAVSGTMTDQVINLGSLTALKQNSFVRENYRFDGWNTKQDKTGTHYDDQEEVLNIIDTESTVTLYAEWTSLINKLQLGSIVNPRINNNAQSFVRYSGTPDFDAINGEVNIATDDSDLPVYLWYDGSNGAMYWWTEAEKTYMNEDSSIFFYNKSNLRSIDLTGLDTSLTTNMWRMFRDTSSLNTLNFGNDFDTSNVENMQAMFEGCALSQLDVSSFDTKNVTTMRGMFARQPNISELDLSTFDTGSLETIIDMFNGSTNLTSLDLSGWDLSNVTSYESWIANTGAVDIDLSNGTGMADMSGFFANSKAKSINLTNFDSQSTTNMSNLFAGSSNLTSVIMNNVDTSNVTNMSGMFSSCTKLESLDLSNLNTQSLTDISSMFAGSNKLTFLDLSGWDLSDVISYTDWIKNTGEVDVDLSNGVGPQNMSNFFGNSNVKSVNLSDFDAHATTDMSFLFNHATHLSMVNLTNINTENVIDMNSLFNECSSLTALDLSDLDTGNVQNMYRMFRSTALTELDLSMLDTKNVTNMSGMFGHVSPLIILDLSGFDTSKVTTMNSMFYNLPVLTTIYATGSFATDSLTDQSGIFYNTPVLRGGAGTEWNSSIMSSDASYARIDDPDNSKPGLFTPKNSRYVRYNANAPTEKTVTGEMKSEYLPAGPDVTPGHLKANAYVLDGYKFMGWATSESGQKVYDDGTEIVFATASRNPLDLYAVWKESTATFATFGAPSTTNVSKFAHYTAGTPSVEILANATNIAKRDSNFPIYGWEDGEYYYWWSEAESARIPSNSSRFFERNGKYVEITFDGIDTSHVTNAMAILHNNTRLKKVDLSNFDTSSLVNVQSMFEACYALETVILPEGFGQNVTDASRMFYGASKLKTINMVDFDSTNLKNTTSMFYGATALTSLTLPENFGKKITDAANMFNGTSIATMNIDDFVPEQPTSIYGMFAGTKMTSIDLSHWNFSSVTSLANLFNNCTNLISVDLGNWSKENITSMSGMFKNTAIPDFSFLESWNVSNVENMSSMFEGTKDTQMDLSSWNVSKVKNMTNMFLSSSLTNLNISTWDTPLLENMYQMLRYTRLTTLDISKLDTRNVTNMVWSLTQMNNLNTVYVGENWNTEGITGGNGASMFDGTFKIVGGAGTVHINEQQYTNQSRARIDDPDNGKPGYFSMKGARYIRYNGNGADNSEYETMTSHYLTNTGSLKANAFVRNGFVFGGWNTAADGSGVDYTDGQVMSDLTESKIPLTLYAMWLSPNGFNGTVDLAPQYSTANVLQKSSTMSQGYVGAAYFDPSDLSKRCNANSANVADKEAKTGCMKWYIYDDSGDSYKMILDHNTTKMITFNSSNNNSSPQALYDRLDADTADWDKTKLSAGILSAADVAAISGINSFNPANSTYYSLGTEVNSSDGKGRSAFGWLYDYTRECETHGCDYEVSTGYGHWTTTPVSGNKKTVWLINYFGRLTFTEAKLGNWGIRPIVTVSKSVVSGV